MWSLQISTNQTYCVDPTGPFRITDVEAPLNPAKCLNISISKSRHLIQVYIIAEAGISIASLKESELPTAYICC